MAKLANTLLPSLPWLPEGVEEATSCISAGDEAPPKLVGIARLAAEGDSLREGHNVEYFTLEARSLLSRVVSQRNLPFAWAINPYRGCEFACKYCYARYTHEFMELRDGVDFERKIFVKQQAAELLRHELKKVKRGEQIAIGTATDPYQPAERRFEVTRAILEELARHAGLEIGIVTKSNLVTRDAELLRQLAENNRLFVNITVTTVDVELARKLEPRAPRPDLRLEAVRQLNLAGVDAGVICAPVLPEITDAPRDSGSAGEGGARCGGEIHLCQSAFSETLFGGGVSALCRGEFSGAGGGLPGSLSRPGVSAEGIWGAVVKVDGGIAAEIWFRERAWVEQPAGASGLCGGTDGIICEGGLALYRRDAESAEEKKLKIGA